MLIPIRTDSPLRSTPWVNWGLIVANVVVFLIQQGKLNNLPGGPPGLLNPQDLQLHSYLTYAFLHADHWHLIGNMIFLYIFGNNVNDKLGNYGYLAFYLGGGVFAGIMHVLTSDAQVLGASGAVAAVTGAYLVLLPRSHVTLILFPLIFFTFEIASMYLILFSFGWDLLNSFTRASNVAHFAHIGGTLFGSAICLGMLWVKLLPRDTFDILALIDRWNRRRQYQVLVRSGYDPFGYVLPDANRKPDPRADKIYEIRARISEAITQRELGKAAELYRELHGVDPEQVLARASQLDIANQFAHDGKYTEAAHAYELFLKHYPNYEQLGHVELMLGIVYARYLREPEKARPHLSLATQRLIGQREYDLAQAELSGLPQIG